VENAQEYGHNFRVAIALNGQLDSLPKEMLTGLLEHSGIVEPMFLDLDVRKRFLKTAPKDLQELIEPALLIWPGFDQEEGWYGINQNSLMLAAAGGLLIATDDDILCKTAMRTGGQPGTLQFSGNYGPIASFWIKNRLQAFEGVQEINLDLLTEYQTYLGASLRELGLPGAPHQAKVNLMSPGTYGDSGYSRARAFLSLEGEERKQAYGLGYVQMRYGRELIRIPQVDTISRSLHFLSMQSGHDLRVCPPPYLAFGRSSDSLFALTRRIIQPQGYTYYPSWGLLHGPEGRQPFQRPDLLDFTPYISELLMAASLAVLPPAEMTEPTDRLKYLGKGLGDLCRGPRPVLQEAVYAHWSQSAQAHKENILRLLEKYRRKPKEWAQDAKAHLQEVDRYLGDPHLLFSAPEADFALEDFAMVLQKYAGTLEYWPELWEHLKQFPLQGKAFPL
jgi:hypothetical protein